MDNPAIADHFARLSKLMDVHGENSFKSKSYANTAFQLERVPRPLSAMTFEDISALKGVGESAAKKITEILLHGSLKQLNELLAATPAGIIEMLSVKGLGAKKIHTIWKEMEIESIGELLYACNENRLTLFKGFGEKTQQNIRDTIEHLLLHQGCFLYAQIAEVAEVLRKFLSNMVAPSRLLLAGSVAMHEDIVNVINFITDANVDKLQIQLSQTAIVYKFDEANVMSFQLEDGFRVNIHFTLPGSLLQTAFKMNCRPEFYEAFTSRYEMTTLSKYETELEYFESIGIPYIPPYLRFQPGVLAKATANQLPVIIEKEDIKGIIHSHSNWSDGFSPLPEMAMAARDKGFEYLVISDHSKSAFYANGLREDRVRAQHEQIEELNEKLAPFKIFKSIESDILNDGSLDYADSVLASFDLVIASVHSNLKMPEEKAMKRLVAAISNPFTTILGHPTGRLLLSRKGYPVDHKMLIDCCAEHGVVLEINAHPRRLDLDWQWVSYAIERGVLLSIDPDAHSIQGFNDIAYGVTAAQKGLLTASGNLSSFSLAQFEAYVAGRKLKLAL